MTGHAYATSARTAARMGPFAGYAENAEHMLRVLAHAPRRGRRHRRGAGAGRAALAPPSESWDDACELARAFGVRNSQATVLAPTGTIGLMMDCDTTGIEPDLGLVKMKKLVGGGTMQIVNQTVPRALRRLGYADEQIAEIIAYIDEQQVDPRAPRTWPPEHVPVFACSMGDNAIHYIGHVQMMGAVQPFISGAISKTINMPEEVTVEEVEQLHIEAWKLGLKAVAIYRDNCKVAQPLAMAKKAGEPATAGRRSRRRPTIVEQIVERGRRQRAGPPAAAPQARSSKTFEFRVADCQGFVTVGEYDDGRPGELFCKVSKQGSTLAGIMDAFAISVSHGLQYGVPLRGLRRDVHQHALRAGGHDRRPRHAVRHEPRRLHLPPAGARLPAARRAHGARHPQRRRALQPTLPGVEEADRARRSTPADLPSTSRPRLSTQSIALAPPPHRPRVRRTAMRPLLPVRRADAAGRLLPRLPQLRHHQRLLVAPSPSSVRARMYRRGTIRPRARVQGRRRTGINVDGLAAGEELGDQAVAEVGVLEQQHVRRGGDDGQPAVRDGAVLGDQVLERDEVVVAADHERRRGDAGQVGLGERGLLPPHAHAACRARTGKWSGPSGESGS